MDGILVKLARDRKHDRFTPQMMVCLVREILLFQGKSMEYNLTRWYGILHLHLIVLDLCRP